MSAAPAHAVSPPTPAAPARSACAVPDGDYVAVVVSVELVEQERVLQRRAAVGSGARTSAEKTRSIAWVFRVCEGPRSGGIIRKVSPATTTQQLTWLRRDLRRLGVSRAREARGLTVQLRVQTAGQWRRVYLMGVAAPMRGDGGAKGRRGDAA